MAFEKDYALYYDAFYHDKDYVAECDFLEKVFQKYSSQKINTILDIGCGTGGHALELAKRGYAVVGVDASETMARTARKKAEELSKIDVRFHVSKMEDMNLGQRFDAIICMFNAINYLTSDEGLDKAFHNFRKHLSDKGLLVFDFRNGITSLRSYSPVRTKWVTHDDKRLLRVSETKLDAMEHLYDTTYTCLAFEDDRIIQEFQDRHVVRYLFPREVKSFLKRNSLQPINMCKFLNLEVPADENEWNIVAIGTGSR
ncbi:MAG: hypothetical protein BA865_09375 [Desulfobacterales bacterium S5133MH4]|nr:MAG: hypothetical protein BA865_09375 [Desulfobacterales bacterium S5133MH4]